MQKRVNHVILPDFCKVHLPKRCDFFIYFCLGVTVQDIQDEATQDQDETRQFIFWTTQDQDETRHPIFRPTQDQDKTKTPKSTQDQDKTKINKTRQSIVRPLVSISISISVSVPIYNMEAYRSVANEFSVPPRRL